MFWLDISFTNRRQWSPMLPKLWEDTEGLMLGLEREGCHAFGRLLWRIRNHFSDYDKRQRF